MHIFINFFYMQLTSVFQGKNVSWPGWFSTRWSCIPFVFVTSYYWSVEKSLNFLFAKYCNELESFTCISFGEKLALQRLILWHLILFLDIISFKRSFPIWFEEIVYHSFKPLEIYVRAHAFPIMYEREWWISNLILSHQMYY